MRKLKNYGYKAVLATTFAIFGMLVKANENKEKEDDSVKVTDIKMNENKTIKDDSLYVLDNGDTLDIVKIAPCKSREEFYAYAFDEFAKIEGKGKPGRPGQIYSDSKGHPTIGVGHLVVHKVYVLGGTVYNKKTKKNKYVPASPAKIAAYREKFIALPLLDKEGKPLSDAVKGQKYDKMISLMKAKRRGLTDSELASINMGHLSEKGMVDVFAKDVESATNRAIEDHADEFWNMPKTAQASLVHMYFWGKGGIAEDLAENRTKTIGEQLPEAVRKGNVAPNIHIRKLAANAAADSIRWKKLQKKPTFALDYIAKALNKRTNS